MDRRKLMTGMAGMAAASLWTPPSAFALGLPKDRIKRIRYYKTPTDAAGRPNIHQPTFNQSTNIVTIETESGLMGVGEGGEPSTMEQCAGLLIGGQGWAGMVRIGGDKGRDGGQGHRQQPAGIGHPAHHAGGNGAGGQERAAAERPVGEGCEHAASLVGQSQIRQWVGQLPAG